MLNGSFAHLALFGYDATYESGDFVIWFLENKPVVPGLKLENSAPILVEFWLLNELKNSWTVGFFLFSD